MRRLSWSGTPRALLAELAERKGAMPRTAMLSRAREIAGTDSGAGMAIKRLMDLGYLVCEYRMTPEGEKVLGRK